MRSKVSRFREVESREKAAVNLLYVSVPLLTAVKEESSNGTKVPCFIAYMGTLATDKAQT